jgi:hypothetical protein
MQAKKEWRVVTEHLNQLVDRQQHGQTLPSYVTHIDTGMYICSYTLMLVCISAVTHIDIGMYLCCYTH